VLTTTAEAMTAWGTVVLAVGPSAPPERSSSRSDRLLWNDENGCFLIGGLQSGDGTPLVEVASVVGVSRSTLSRQLRPAAHGPGK